MNKAEVIIESLKDFISERTPNFRAKGSLFHIDVATNISGTIIPANGSGVIEWKANDMERLQNEINGEVQNQIEQEFGKVTLVKTSKLDSKVITEKLSLPAFPTLIGFNQKKAFKEKRVVRVAFKEGIDFKVTEYEGQIFISSKEKQPFLTPTGEHLTKVLERAGYDIVVTGADLFYLEFPRIFVKDGQ